jgi:hypothetical protein
MKVTKERHAERACGARRRSTQAQHFDEQVTKPRTLCETCKRSVTVGSGTERSESPFSLRISLEIQG